MSVTDIKQNVVNARAKRRRVLSDEFAQGEPPPRKGRKEFWHVDRSGLMLRITSNGARSWAVAFRVRDTAALGTRGKARRGVKSSPQKITLGAVEDIAFEAAHTRAKEIRKQADAGIDPREKINAERETRRANTVQNVAEKLVKASKKTNRAWHVQESVLRVHVYPRIGERPIADITRADVFDLLDALKEEKSVATAREVRKHLGRLMNWAANRTIIPVNPMAGLEDKSLVYKKRERVLTDAELRAVWIGAASLSYPYGQVVRLLMLTGQRKSEICGARWSEMDDADRTLFVPPERHKPSRGQLVPLTAAAWEIIEALPRHQGYDNLFLVAPRRKGDVELVAADMGSDMDDKLREAALKVLRENDPEAKMDHWVVHDLRRTCETRLAKLKVTQEHIDRVMGHAKKGMASTYNRYDYLPEKRAALELYEAHLLGVVQ